MLYLYNFCIWPNKPMSINNHDFIDDRPWSNGNNNLWVSSRVLGHSLQVKMSEYGINNIILRYNDWTITIESFKYHYYDHTTGYRRTRYFKI